MANFSLTRKSTWKKILSAGLAVLLVAGAIFGVVKISERLKDDKKKITPAWEIGVISEADGKADPDDKTSIYTKDAFDAKGLEVELDFDADCTYQVFWFNKVGEFIFSSGEMTKGSEFYAPAGYKARVEVTPNLSNDNDGEISWFETFKYSKQVAIRVEKEQALEAKDFVEVALTETAVFTAHKGQVYNFSEKKFESSDVVDTYVFQNPEKGIKYSACYVKDFEVGEHSTIKGLYVRLVDGTTIYYYNSNGTETEVVPGYREESQIKLPMSAKDAIMLPAGATLYVYGVFESTEDDAGKAANTHLMFY